MTSKVISTGYIPRAVQVELHQNCKRFNVVVAHRRLGKTLWAINHMLDKGLRNPLKNPQYAFVGPNFGQVKRVAWDYLKEYCRNLPGVQFNEAELRVDFFRPGTKDRVRFMLLSAENPDSLRGLYLDGAVLDEFSVMDPTAWSQVIRPALSDRMGWCVFIGTPKGENHFFDMLETAKRLENDGWFWVIYRASETNIIPKSELDAAKKEMTESEYAQEYECSFGAALTGAYYGKEMEIAEREGRITKVPYEAGSPVHTFWDLGIGDTTAIWFFQQVGREPRCIDYYEDSGRGFDFYAKILKGKPYTYGEHTLPHDGSHRELGTGVTRQRTLLDLGVRTRILPKHSPDDGIHASRMLLKKIWIDEDKCLRGIKALRNYTKRWDAKNKIWSSGPLHNWASHSADAFRILSMGLKDGLSDNSTRDLPRQAAAVYDYYNEHQHHDHIETDYDVYNY